MGHTSKIIHPIPCEWLLALVHKSRMVGSSPVSTSGIILLSVGPEGEINHQILPIKSPEKIPIPISLIYDATNHINNDRNHTEKIHIIHIDPSRFTIIKKYIYVPLQPPFNHIFHLSSHGLLLQLHLLHVSLLSQRLLRGRLRLRLDRARCHAQVLHGPESRGGSLRWESKMAGKIHVSMIIIY